MEPWRGEGGSALSSVVFPQKKALLRVLNAIFALPCKFHQSVWIFSPVVPVLVFVPACWLSVFLSLVLQQILEEYSWNHPPCYIPFHP
jgi:hypothetical protein